MHYDIGIMEGRLTPSKGRGIQFFPFDNWRNEFDIAKEIGLDQIEFIFDYDSYEENPLWVGNGEMIREAIESTGVMVRTVCFDYFMRRPFYKFNGSERDYIREENKKVLLRIIKNMSIQKINLIEIPLVDNSSIKEMGEKQLFFDFISDVISIAPTDIRFGFESDWGPEELADFLGKFDEKRVGANYDTGNSSGIGYDPEEELKAYGNRIFNIHIKDRIKGGNTVELGTGSAEFDRFFASLSHYDYHGAFILQAARSKEGRERENICSQVEFVREYILRYL